jgi:hypothetical protein
MTLTFGDFRLAIGGLSISDRPLQMGDRGIAVELEQARDRAPWRAICNPQSVNLQSSICNLQ